MDGNFSPLEVKIGWSEGGKALPRSETRIRHWGRDTHCACSRLHPLITNKPLRRTQIQLNCKASTVYIYKLTTWHAY